MKRSSDHDDDFFPPEREGVWALKSFTFDWLSGDLYFHEQVRQALVSAGFQVIRIEKYWFNSIWEARMSKHMAEVPESPRHRLGWFTGILDRGGISPEPGTLRVAVQGRSVKCAFAMAYGVVAAI